MDQLKPDIYIAAIGRSGSTMLCNILTREPDQIMFIEPKFHTPPYRNILKPQLAQYGMEFDESKMAAVQDLPPDQVLETLLGAHLRPIKWGFKEVQCSEHRRVVDLFAPTNILVNVRHIFNIALSFFEKHRRQDNQDRFPASWVRDYCLRETQGLVGFCQDLAQQRIAYRVVRYEDFMTDPQERKALGDHLGWHYGESPDRFLTNLDRGFEVRRHAAGRFRETSLADRGSSALEIRYACEIEELCAQYQAFFGYQTGDAP